MRRVALITGASRGLGAEIAMLLARRDYELIITARGNEALNKRADLLAAYGSKVQAVAGDVADQAHRRVLAQIVAKAGRLDLLINNASGLGPSPMPPLAEYPLDELQRLFATNVVAPLALAQETLPVLKESRGLIVNISSDAALGGYPDWGGYGSTKAALDLLSLTLANELRAADVSVISVDPGDMRTDMQQRAFPGEDISDRPLPEVTVPFWMWLFEQDPLTISGRRYEAQAEQWEIIRETD